MKRSVGRTQNADADENLNGGRERLLFALHEAGRQSEITSFRRRPMVPVVPLREQRQKSHRVSQDGERHKEEELLGRPSRVELLPRAAKQDQSRRAPLASPREANLRPSNLKKTTTTGNEKANRIVLIDVKLLLQQNHTVSL